MMLQGWKMQRQDQRAVVIKALEHKADGMRMR
jgi:hypothetical protein